MSDNWKQLHSRYYGDMSYQRQHANRSMVCNCCGGNRVREQRLWPKPDDEYYRGAVCMTCDAGAEDE